MYIIIDAESNVKVYTSETFKEMEVASEDIVLFVEGTEIAVSEVSPEGDMNEIDPE